jgi:hypothetical protein
LNPTSFEGGSGFHFGGQDLRNHALQRAFLPASESNMFEDPPVSSPAYRLFHIADDGHIKKSDVLDALSDAHALLLAKSLINGCPVEVWDRARRVARLMPDQSATAALP